jgi:predicted acylesterase/phospholipase RssA
MSSVRVWLALGLAFLTLSLGGCVTLPRAQFSAAEQAAASPPGFDHVRYTPDDPVLAAMLGRALKSNAQGDMDVLAMSGGGANGAYGAGLLYGWSKTGQRPEFQLVTGVSAGALAAPFAFLGPDWDERLRQTYADPKIHRLMRSRGLLGLLTPGLYSKTPLDDLVARHVTDEMVRAVAAEHAKGRRLLVGTTNLDTEQLIVWDMGAIAAQGGPQARKLFIEVLIASASVPGVFAPSMIEVRSAGRRFAEMHVDGQAEGAFFAVPQTLLSPHGPAERPYKPQLFIVVNGHMAGVFSVTPRAVMPILSRTLNVASKASIRSSVIGTQDYCQHNGCDLLLAILPAALTDDPMDFGDDHISSLFSAGEDAMRGGRAWEAAAPALASPPNPGGAP